MLGAKLAFAKPDNPNEFLKNELNKIKEMKKNGEPVSKSILGKVLKVFIRLFQVTLFSEEDLVTMFSIFDITGRGYITQLQYKRGNMIHLH
jgi:Ca2+-binding EF-hand superfamily protein